VVLPSPSRRGLRDPPDQGEDSGTNRYLRFNQEFPGDWHLTLRVAIADEESGVAWFIWEVDGSEPADAVAFFTFSDGLITSVTDFWPEPYEPPSGREHLVERW
jgi:hypothetical protein